MADRWAKRAATEDGHPEWPRDAPCDGDPVQIFNNGGSLVLVARRALADAWWSRRGQSRARARPWLDLLYPEGVALDWPQSTVIFRRPIVRGGAFVHPVGPAVIKWIARIRAGCLASRARLVGHGLEQGSGQCLCCGAEVEDDIHIVSGCPATGTQDWQLLVSEAWGVAGRRAGLQVLPPPEDILVRDRFLLLRPQMC